MSKSWAADKALVNSMTLNLCEAAVVLPRQLLRVDELVHKFGMPFSHIQILVLLSTGDRSIGRISAVLGIAKPNITPLLDSLCNKGYVERVRSQEDRRIVHVHLTELGQDMVDKIRKMVGDQVVQWEDRFSRSDVKRLNTAIATMLSMIDNGESFLQEY